MLYNLIPAVTCLMIAFLPLLAGDLVPMHDGMTVFGLFHYFYTQFFSYNHLALWAPYDFFGQPTHFAQVVSLSPLTYLAMVLGKIFHITNTLWLFKFVMGLEVLVFTAGLRRLGLRVYKSALSIWFVTILGGVTAIWLTQPFFNFRIYYMWPWVLISLLDFSQKKSLGNLAWAGIWLLTGMLGNLPYFAGVWLLAAVIVTGMLLLYNKNITDPMSAEGYPWMVFCVILAGGLFFYMKGLSHGVALIAPDRLADGSSTMTQFLSYGDKAHPGLWLKGILGFRPFFLWGLWDITPFLGILTTCFCLWSLAAAGHALARAVNAVVVVLILMMFVPLAGGILYFFPLVKYYRHLALLGGFAKFFMVVSAGFGCDDLYQRFLSRHRGWLFLLILFGAGEILFYQCRIWQDIIRVNPKVEQLQSVVGVSPMPWQTNRTDEPGVMRSRQASLLVQEAALNGGRFTTDYDFIQWDVCNSPWRRDWAVNGVKDLQEINSNFLGVLGGCQVPKLRLVGKAVVMTKQDYGRILSWVNLQMMGSLQQSRQQAEAALADVTQKLNAFIVVPGSTSLPEIQEDMAEGRVKVTNFDSNSMTADAFVDGHTGAWLVYADGYHEGWRASLDGKPVKVVKADLAFKTVWVPAGTHQIKFFFFDGLQAFLSYALMFWGCLAAVLMLGHLMTFGIPQRT